MILRRVLHDAHWELKNTFARVRARLRHSQAAKPRLPRVLDLAQLEERVLLSASPIGPEVAAIGSGDGFSIDGTTATNTDAATASIEVTDQGGPSQANSGQTTTTGSDQPFDFQAHTTIAATTVAADQTTRSLSEAATRQEIVFIDTGAQDYQQLVNDLLQNHGDDRQISVVLLDSARHGVAQITQTLAGYDDLDAVHFVTHATDRAVKLGGTWLTTSDLADRSDLPPGPPTASHCPRTTAPCAG